MFRFLDKKLTHLKLPSQNLMNLIPRVRTNILVGGGCAAFEHREKCLPHPLLNIGCGNLELKDKDQDCRF